jgi:hypothetical protein
VVTNDDVAARISTAFQTETRKAIIKYLLKFKFSLTPYFKIVWRGPIGSINRAENCDNFVTRSPKIGRRPA